VRAVIYARLSEDHERAESVPTQIANGTKYAERMGWDVVRVFKDEGRSGYTGEHRPGFEEMIKFLCEGDVPVLIARHHDRLTRNPDGFARLMQVCGKAKIKISLYTGGELDLSTASGGFYGFMETGRSWYESAIRSQRVKDAVERNARAGKRSGGGSRPFGYKIIRHDLGEGGNGGIASSARRSSQPRPRRSRRRLHEYCEARASAASPSTLTIAASSESQAGGGQGRRCVACWFRRGSPGFVSTTAMWSATRHGQRSSSAPLMIDWLGCLATRTGDARTSAGPACTRLSVWSTARRAAGG
jgi:DNA invertase Pin-like site-specific DNA recombinase